MIGRYMINMGTIEMTSRLIVLQIKGSDRDPIFSSELSLRIGFIKNSFPREHRDRHTWAMKVLKVAAKHVGFRNIVAHSALVITKNESGIPKIQGLLALTPKDRANFGTIVSLEELTGRVNETALVGRKLMEMQNDFN
jgi:hypothetical protein